MPLRAQDMELMDRRELWRMLERLGPHGWVPFLTWCCKQVSGRPMTGEVRVTRPPVNVHEAYMDVLQCQVVYGLDLEKALEELTRRVRRL